MFSKGIKRKAVGHQETGGLPQKYLIEASDRVRLGFCNETFEILNVFTPRAFPAGHLWLKFSPSLNFNKNEHFSKVSPCLRTIRNEILKVRRVVNNRIL
jgi:hypothetical protein